MYFNYLLTMHRMRQRSCQMSFKMHESHAAHTIAAKRIIQHGHCGKGWTGE